MGNLDLQDGVVDVVLLFDVIHYLKNRDVVLGEIYRVLKEDGRLAVDVHHVGSAVAVQGVQESGYFQLVSEIELHEKHSNGLLLFAKKYPPD